MSWSCPVCWSGLVAAPTGPGLACAVCRQRFPVVTGTATPVIVPNVDAMLHESAIAIRALEAGAIATREAITARLARNPRRVRAIERMRDGLDSALAMFQRWRELLAPMLPAGVLDPDPSGATLDMSRLNSVFRSFLVDWSYRPETEALLATKLAAIRATLSHAPERKRLVVLGAGLGRVASELAADFDEVVAIDLAMHVGLGRALLAQGPLVLHEPVFVDVERVDDLCRPVTLELRLNPPNLRVAVANALRTPLAAGSASTVLLDYFIDIAPTTPLLRECKRLLAPGGLLVNFGPLGHPADRDIDETFTAEEVRELLADLGYRIVADDFVTHPFWPTSMLIERVVRGWCFAAVRT